MQERLIRGGAIEIAAFAPEYDVGEEACAEKHMLAQLRQLGRGQDHKTVNQYGGQAYSKRRKNAPYAPSIEGGEREAVFGYFSEKYFRDKEARNDEEDVYAHKAAGDDFRKSVIEHH